jgi:hypothetical protein
VSTKQQATKNVFSFHLAPDASYCPKMAAPAKWSSEDLFANIKE